MRSRWTDFLTSDGEKPDRNRDTEFEIGDRSSRAQIVAAWEDGWKRVIEAIAALKPEDLAKSVRIRGEAHTVVEAINRQVTHYASHVGQIVLLAKHYAGANWTTLSIPRGKSREFDVSKKGSPYSYKALGRGFLIADAGTGGAVCTIPFSRTSFSMSSSSIGRKSVKFSKPVARDHDGVLVAQVEILFGHPKLRVDREDLARLERAAAVAADVVDGHADGVREHAAAALDERPRRLLVNRLRELRPREDRLHRLRRFLHDLRRRSRRAGCASAPPCGTRARTAAARAATACTCR